jgi:hypothetical protein
MKPFSGNGKPFVYTAYAPQDADDVHSILEHLASRGYAIWPGVKYNKTRLDKAALVILFLSPAAAADETIDRTVNYAVQKDKPMLVVHLAPVQLSPAQQLMLNSLHGILRYDCASGEEFNEKLFGSALLKNLRVTPAQKRAARLTTWGFAGGVLAAAAIAVFLALGVTAEIPEDSLLTNLGYSGRIADIKSIYIYGNRIEETRSDGVICSIIYERAENSAMNTVFYNDLNSANAYGDIADISDFSQLRNLRELSIAGNRIENIRALYPLRKLEFLDLSGNPIVDVDGIGAMKRLKTLCIGGTQIMDLSALDACNELEQVYVDPYQYQLFSQEASRHSFAITPIGPRQELAKLSCHIFGGPDEGCLYGLYVKTKSSNVYEDYNYQFYKNDRQIRITGRSYENLTMDKTHMLIDEEAMGGYDPESVYTLIVTYGSCSATYQLWHYLDQNVEDAGIGNLIETTGLSNE